MLGSYTFGLEVIFWMNIHTLGITKIDKISQLEILRVKTLVDTLCTVFVLFLTISIGDGNHLL